jgi:recombination protein RecA
MATNAQRAAAKALKQKQEEDPDFVAPVVETDKHKLVEAAIKSIKKESGTSFIRLGSKSQEMRPVLPTGIFGIDHDVFGSGGAPRGRIVEIFGAPSGGKGTFTSQLLANTQRLNPKDENAYIDAEHALDPVYAGRLGVDVDNLLLAQPDCGEDALQATLDIISTGAIKLCVVDSVAALVPRAELEGAMSDSHMGLTARMMGQALRKLTGIVSKTGTCLVFINQTRSNLGVTFGNPTTTPGGKALTFFSSVRLQIDRISQYKEKEQNIGNVTKFKGVKNKTAPPFRETNLNLLFDLPGFDGPMSLTSYAIDNGIWKQDGSMYMLVSTGEVIKGRVGVRDALRDNKELRKITEEATLTAMGKSHLYIKRALRG